jgi:serine protease Do
MASKILISGICVVGFAAQVMLATPPGETPRAHTAGNRIVVTRGSSYLGVAVVELTADRAKELHLKDERGVEVTCVDADSPAAKAGLKPGDVVIEYNGERVEGGEQFIRLVRETPPGRAAKLNVWRNNGNQTLTATIGQRQPNLLAFSLDSPEPLSMPVPPEMPLMPAVPTMPDMPRTLMSWRSPMLGIESEALNPQLAEFFGVKEGVLVRSVTANSTAQKAGFKAGDVIIKVDGQPVVTPKEVSTILQSARAKKTFPIIVVRHQKEVVLNVTLEENSQWPVSGTRQML